MKIAYAGHVAFTERILYTVGQNCGEDPTDIDQLPLQGAGGPATKFLRDGQLLIERNGKTYTASGVPF